MDIVKIINLEDKDGRIEWNVCWANALQAYGPEEVQQEDPEAWREEYRAKQAAGVKYEQKHWDSSWHSGLWHFDGENKEDYREVPLPHVKERALYWKQRAAGTNEVWQAKYIKDWVDIYKEEEPEWLDCWEYRPKPKPAKLTAKTVTYYMAMVKHQSGVVVSCCQDKKETIFEAVRRHNAIIIGDIVEREVEC